MPKLKRDSWAELGRVSRRDSSVHLVFGWLLGMTVYDVEEVCEMPSFDPTKMVKHVVLSPCNVQRVSRITRRYASLITASYFLGSLLDPAVLFTPPHVAQIFAVVEAMLELPVFLMVLLSVRADLVLLIVSSYDFWFLTVSTMVHGITYSLSFRDLRVVLALIRSFGFQMGILIDANAYQPRSLVYAALLNIGIVMLNVVAISLDAVPGVDSVDEDNPSSPISIRDMAVNGMATMTILLIRIVYYKVHLTRSASIARSRTTTGRPTKGHTIVQCVMIRCTIKLREAVLSCRQTPHRDPSSSGSLGRVVLRRVTNEAMLYDSSMTLSGLSPQHELRGWQQGLLRVMGASGVTLLGVCTVIMFSTEHLKPSASAIVLCTTTLLTTTVYVGTSFAFSNRRMLAHVCKSFDFVFLSIQITMAHVCVADMLQWRLSAVVVTVAAWLWVHWVLTLDALLPDTRQRIGLRNSRVVALVVLMLYITGQLAFLIVGLLWSNWQLRNRVFLHFRFLRFHVKCRVLPFFISRMITVSLWTLRLLWRFSFQDDSKQLTMVRGHLEFEYDHRSRSTAKLASIGPLPAPPPEPSQLKM